MVQNQVCEQQFQGGIQYSTYVAPIFFGTNHTKIKDMITKSRKTIFWIELKY